MQLNVIQLSKRKQIHSIERKNRTRARRCDRTRARDRIDAYRRFGRMKCTTTTTTMMLLLLGLAARAGGFAVSPEVRARTQN